MIPYSIIHCVEAYVESWLAGIAGMVVFPPDILLKPQRTVHVSFSNLIVMVGINPDMLYVLMEGTELVRMEFVVRYHGPVFHVVGWKLIHLPGKSSRQ